MAGWKKVYFRPTVASFGRQKHLLDLNFVCSEGSLILTKWHCVFFIGMCSDFSREMCSFSADFPYGIVDRFPVSKACECPGWDAFWLRYKQRGAKGKAQTFAVDAEWYNEHELMLVISPSVRRLFPMFVPVVRLLLCMSGILGLGLSTNHQSWFVQMTFDQSSLVSSK